MAGCVPVLPLAIVSILGAADLIRRPIGTRRGARLQRHVHISLNISRLHDVAKDFPPPVARRLEIFSIAQQKYKSAIDTLVLAQTEFPIYARGSFVHIR